MKTTDAVQAFVALGQESRLNVFRLIIQKGDVGLTPTQINELLGIPNATLSFHLKELLNADLISVERQSRNLIYRPNAATVDALMRFLMDNCCGGKSCMPIQLMEKATMTPYNILFLCTHNSARSILGEAIASTQTHGKFIGYSAGSTPGNNVSPFAIELAREMRYPVEKLRSKSWDEYAMPDAPQMDFIITVCDSAAGEVCPIWPGKPASAHWSFPDPSQVQGSDEDKRRAFREVMYGLKRRIEILAALPFEKLDALTIQQELKKLANI